MKKTKFAYLFATTLVAGTMGLTSCSEEGENLIPTDGKTTKVAISMSLAQQTRATADEVNMGTTIQDINNVVIVPFIGDVAQNIITMPKFTASTETNKYYKTATLAQAVNKFRVYGNLPGTFADNGAFVFPDLTRTNADAPMNAFYKPYDLYYYTEASTTGNIVQVATTGPWESASWGNMTSNIGENTMVKIGGVKYAVGVLAAAVLDGVTGENATKNIFADGKGEENVANASWNDMKGSNPFEVVGIVVEGQPLNMDATFTQSGDVKVFESAVATALSTKKIEFDAQNKVANANVYCVVAPENGQSIIVNFVFKNVSEKVLKLNNGGEVGNGEYFYLYATLRPDADNDIFSAATSTLLNATVQDWGRGTTTIVETTDVAIGLVIDTAWAKGIAFDENI